MYVKCILLINKMFYYKNAQICYSKAVTWQVKMLALQDNFNICCYNDKVATKAVEASVLPDCCLESREISLHRNANLVSFVSQIIHALTVCMHHMLSLLNPDHSGSQAHLQRVKLFFESVCCSFLSGFLSGCVLLQYQLCGELSRW